MGISNILRTSALIIGAFLFTSVIVFGQDSLVERAPNKWSLGLSYSPGITNNLSSRPGETFKYSFLSGGLYIRYDLTKKLLLKSGLAIIDRGYTANHGICLGFKCYNTQYKSIYLDIPILIHYKLVKLKKIDLFTSVGLVSSLLIYNPNGLFYQYDDDKNSVNIVYEDDYKVIAASAEAGIGVAWNISAKYHVSFEQFLQYAIMEFQNNRTTFLDYDGTLYSVNEPRYVYRPFFMGIRVSLFKNI